MPTKTMPVMLASIPRPLRIGSLRRRIAVSSAKIARIHYHRRGQQYDGFTLHVW